MAGRLCTTCGHVNRWAIELRLKSQSIRVVAARFGISRSALHRHKTRHLRVAVQQTSEPVRQEEESAQRLEAPDTVEIVPPVPEPPEPASPNRLATLPEPSKSQKDPAGRLGPCPICGSNRWRQLDGNLTCDVCHPLPPSGSFGHTGHAIERCGAATPMMVGSRPSALIRVPIALSGV